METKKNHKYLAQGFDFKLEAAESIAGSAFQKGHRDDCVEEEGLSRREEREGR